MPRKETPDVHFLQCARLPWDDPAPWVGVVERRPFDSRLHVVGLVGGEVAGASLTIPEGPVPDGMGAWVNLVARASQGEGPGALDCLLAAQRRTCTNHLDHLAKRDGIVDAALKAEVEAAVARCQGREFEGFLQSIP